MFWMVIHKVFQFSTFKHIYFAGKSEPPNFAVRS